MIRSAHVSLPCKCISCNIRIVYVFLRCIDPDWKGTVREQTDIHLFK